MTPTEIQLVAPAFIDAFKRAEKDGYDAVVPLGTLDWESMAANQRWTSPSSDRPKPACTSPR